MIRNLKVLGLALVAMLAMAAMGASAASAAEFHSEGSETILTGKQEALDVFSTTGGTVECDEATYVGSQTGTTTTTSKATPTYSKCTAFGFASASINTNGCEYQFHSNGTVDIVNCKTNEGIIVTASLFGTQKCKVTVVPQTGINGITYTSIGSGTTREITIDVESNNVEYIEHGGTGFGACSSSTAQKNGEYEGSSVVTGENKVGTHLGIWFA